MTLRRGIPASRRRTAATATAPTSRRARRPGSSPASSSPGPPGRKTATPPSRWRLLAAGDGLAGVYGDSAYGTGDLRAALDEAGHTAVIKPGPLKPAVEGGFTTDDFTVDEPAGTVTCPAGLTRRITARRT